MHKHSWKLAIMAAVLALPFGAHAETKTVKLNTHEHGQSATLAEHLPDTVQDSKNQVNLRRRNIAGSERNNIGAFKFDLPIGATPDVIAAKLSFATYVDVGLSAEILVYGLNADATKGSVTAANWSESTITYNSMPGLFAADGNLQNPSVNPAEAVFLGNIAVAGGTVAMSPISLSTQALLDYINANSGGSVTFLLEIRQVGSGRDEEVQLLSGQRASAGDGFYPTLELTTQIPEPGHAAGVVLLAAAMCVFAKKRAANRRRD